MGKEIADFAMRTMSRKFWLVVSILSVATALLVYAKIGEATWGNVVNWLVTAYIAGNLVERLKWLADNNSKES